MPSGNAPPADLAIVILNYNTRDLLRDCLTSLRDQAGLNFATCVVDNASPDDSADMVAREFPEVCLIRNPHNNGYSAGNNLGLRRFGFPDQPQARYAMLLNPDTVVPPSALCKMVAFADANPGRRLRMWARFVHTGEYYGILGQTVAGLASAGGVMLVWTGISLALRRFAAWKARRRKREPILAEVSLVE